MDLNYSWRCFCREPIWTEWNKQVRRGRSGESRKWESAGASYLYEVWRETTVPLSTPAPNKRRKAGNHVIYISPPISALRIERITKVGGTLKEKLHV